MVWSQLGVTRPHVAYATTAFGLTLLGALSMFLKDKAYVGEVPFATIYGLIVGPHALDWFSPKTWGNSDYITSEISRIVLVVQIFAVAAELPKKYILRNWFSLLVVLIPVMTYGWILSSVFIWKLVPTLRWVEALAIAACVTATDPVLSAAVVGKGGISSQIPVHLRNLLSAESACNDGMAFPFALLALNILKHEGHPGTIAKDFIAVSVLYEVVFGCILGAFLGLFFGLILKLSTRYKLIDHEACLAFYFFVPFFVAGIATILGVDDLLVAFFAGTAINWDGWFMKHTGKSHIAAVFDVILNLAYFIYFGAIVPWNYFNHGDIGLSAWKLVLLAIIILVVRRIPILLALKPAIPNVRTWHEALFAGHFGPIGVAAVFVSIMIRAELEDSHTPLKDLPPPGSPHYFLIATIWPVTCFLIVSSIIVHGVSVALVAWSNQFTSVELSREKSMDGSILWVLRLPSPDVETDLLLYVNSKGKLQRIVKDDHNSDDEEPVAVSKLPRLSKRTISLQIGDKLHKLPSNSGSPEDIRIYHQDNEIVVEGIDGSALLSFNVDNLSAQNSSLKMSLHQTTTVNLESPVNLRDSSASPDSDEFKNDTVSDRRTMFENDRMSYEEDDDEEDVELMAFMVGDHLMFENADGELLSQYHVQRYGSKAIGYASSLRKFRKWLRSIKKSNEVKHIRTEHDPNLSFVPVGRFTRKIHNDQEEQ